MKILWQDGAWDDYLYFQKKDRKILNKVNSLLKDIERHGYNCSSKLEHLSYGLNEYYSVRIDKKNRLVFKIEDDYIEVYQCGSHYGEK